MSVYWKFQAKCCAAILPHQVGTIDASTAASGPIEAKGTNSDVVAHLSGEPIATYTLVVTENVLKPETARLVQCTADQKEK